MAPRYAKLWGDLKILPNRLPEVKLVANKILANKNRYLEVCKNLTIHEDWWVLIGCIHYRESDLNFHTHLANGDPLTHKTVHVPKGEPPGNPPFSWEYAAEWALRRYHASTLPEAFSPEHMAYFCEAYNGWGYEERGVSSSYLWSGTNAHLRGKFVRDGVYSRTAVDEQEGVMAILQCLLEAQPKPVVSVTPKSTISAPVGEKRTSEPQRTSDPPKPVGSVRKPSLWSRIRGLFG